jgi:hypothetical protein
LPSLATLARYRARLERERHEVEAELARLRRLRRPTPPAAIEAPHPRMDEPERTVPPTNRAARRRLAALSRQRPRDGGGIRLSA